MEENGLYPEDNDSPYEGESVFDDPKGIDEALNLGPEPSPNSLPINDPRVLEGSKIYPIENGETPDELDPALQSAKEAIRKSQTDAMLEKIEDTKAFEKMFQVATESFNGEVDGWEKRLIMSEEIEWAKPIDTFERRTLTGIYRDAASALGVTALTYSFLGATGIEDAPTSTSVALFVMGLGISVFSTADKKTR